jgi:membrane-associated protease RseP (regulator of RpoE activity)
MRRFKALLIAAGLAAAPASAAAGPNHHSDTDHRDRFFEHFEASAGHGRLGVYVMSLTPELRKHFNTPDDRGLMVARVEPLSPAAKAGIQPGDIVTEVRGHAVAEADDMIGALSDVPKDQSIAIKLVRDGKPLELTAKMSSDMTSFLDPGWWRDFFKPLESST